MSTTGVLNTIKPFSLTDKSLGAKTPAMSASSKIPAVVRDKVSEKAKKVLDIVEKFVEEECLPAEAIYTDQLGENHAARWGQPSVMEDLKKRAKELGLWNLFLPKNHYTEGAGFSNLEYGLMAEYLGKSRVSQEATNNSAPDTGNMEVLAKYGTDQQKRQWLQPLLNGDIRSAYVMTEPDSACSDATNVHMSIMKSGNEWVLNGSKWWISGAGSPHCKLYIVMGKTDPTNPNAHKQQSIVLVPSNAKGITIRRMMSVYGYDDAPHGHGHLEFKDVRVPLSNIILGEGRGFEIMQGRLGPGRIHHAMRGIGSAELALEWMLSRANDPRKMPFGKLLSEHGTIIEGIARSRIEIDAARLMVLNAAHTIDETDAKTALKEIAEIKVLIPAMALTVIDRAVQSFGGEGISENTPLAYMWAQARVLRLADGPDEVHIQQLGRRENKRGPEMLKKIQRQSEIADRLFLQYGKKDTAWTARL